MLWWQILLLCAGCLWLGGVLMMLFFVVLGGDDLGEEAHDFIVRVNSRRVRLGVVRRILYYFFGATVVLLAIIGYPFDKLLPGRLDKIFGINQNKQKASS